MLTHFKRKLAVGMLIPILAFAAGPTLAGVLYGLEISSWNGRSGRPEDSNLDIRRAGNLDAYCGETTDPGPRRMIYPMDVPKNAEIFSVDVWAYDNAAANDLSLRLIESCQPFLTATPPTHVELATAATSGSPGAVKLSLFTAAHAANVSVCAYYLEAGFAEPGLACAGPELTLRRVRLMTNDPDVIFRDDFAQ